MIRGWCSTVHGELTASRYGWKFDVDYLFSLYSLLFRGVAGSDCLLVELTPQARAARMTVNDFTARSRL